MSDIHAPGATGDRATGLGSKLHLPEAFPNPGRPSKIAGPAFFCVAVLSVACLISPRCLHWFVVPLFLCGIAIGSDALEWVRGRCDALDPRGIIGAIALHCFFLAPLLHVCLDSWMAEVTDSLEWRNWLGGMACLNFVGLLIYRRLAGLAERRIGRAGAAPLRRLRYGGFFSVGALLLLASAMAQYTVYSRFGGILGYISAYEMRSGAFRGMGALFALSESFPVIFALGVVSFWKWRRHTPSWISIAALLILVFSLLILFGGLRGSRSNTVWGLFWTVGVIHLCIRPIPRWVAPLALATLIAFMYAYAFYKSGGIEGMADFVDPDARITFENRMRRGVEDVLLGDLARADVHAFMLYALWGPQRDYDYALGRTYLGAASLLIPRSVWQDRPPTKILEGTELLRGRGSFRGDQSGQFFSMRVYGIQGEAMLNFGPLAAPFALGLLGLLVGCVRGLRRRWHIQDARLLYYPFLVNLCLVVLVLDSDNVLFFTAKYGALPIALILLLSAKVANTGVRLRHEIQHVPRGESDA